MSSDKIFATAARGFDQIADGLQRQLQVPRASCLSLVTLVLAFVPLFVEAALQHASDARLRNAFQGKGLAAAAFMVQSTSTGGSVHTLRISSRM